MMMKMMMGGKVGEASEGRDAVIKGSEIERMIKARFLQEDLHADLYIS